MTHIVFFKEVVKHLVSVGPTEVNVEVGRVFAVEVDEAFKVEVQLHGIHVGDSQAVGHHRVGSGASTHMVEVAAMGKADNVVIDQEIRHKTLLLDQFQFLFNALADGCGELWVALLSSSEGFLAEKFKILPAISE